MKQETKIKIGILVACSSTLGYMCITPALADITAAFPQVPLILSQLIITLPSFTLMVFSLVAGWSERRVGGKRLIVIGTSLQLVGGVFPFFIHSSIVGLLFSSAVIGAGLGLMMQATNSMICSIYSGSERSRMLGYNATCVNVGSLVFSFLGGQLSQFSWFAPYLAFLMMIPVLVISLRWLPHEPKKENTLSEAHQQIPSASGGLPALFFIGALYFTAQNAFHTNSSLYIKELALGGAVVSSLVTGSNAVGGIIGGIVFGKLERRIGEQIQSVALVISATGFLLMISLPMISGIITGGALIGAAFAMINASGTWLISRRCVEEQQSKIIAGYLSVVNLFAASSPLLLSALSEITLGNSPRKRLCVACILIAVAAAICWKVLRRKDISS